MNENEKITEISTEAVETEAAASEEKSEETENAAVCTASDDSDALSHPMFAHFAKGKRGNIEDICRDFKEMLATAGVTPQTDVAAKMTPSVSGTASPDVALTERQRMIARAAGMSYREYYALVSDVPVKRK